MQSLAANVLQLDLALADYGPETAPARAEIKQRVAKTVDQIWGGHESDKAFVALNLASAIDVLHNSDRFLDTLHPATDEQKQVLARARQIAATIGQARLQMAFALTDPVSYPLVVIVVSWAFFLFCGFGLLSKHNLMSFVAVAVGAMAIATAMYLIMDLSAPYSGLFRASSEPIEQVLDYMNKKS